MQNGNRVWVNSTVCEKRKSSQEATMGFKTGNYMTGIGFLLVLLMSAVEPMPHSFELFWLHVGTLMIGAVLMGSGTYLTWKGK